jgi:hypothetical protein
MVKKGSARAVGTGLFSMPKFSISLVRPVYPRTSGYLPMPRHWRNPLSFSCMAKNLLTLLEGGDRRSIGRADQVAVAVSKDRALFPTLMQGWWSDDPLVRMRAADATEKVTRKNPDLLPAYKKQLLKLLADVEQQELRWHLAALVPRLPLSHRERDLAASSLRCYLQDQSSIVKTCALQALADLAKDDSTMRREVKKLLSQSLRNGTPAMKARSRRLLHRLDSDD